MNFRVSFWLVPAAEERVFFQEIIDKLAQEHQALSFVPHVTIYSGEYKPNESISSLIDKAIQDVGSFSLKVDKILYSEQLAKTLFVQFHQSEVLSKISDSLRNNSQHPSDYSLNPHLSLIYQFLSEETKQELANLIKLSKAEVVFNEVQAIAHPETLQSAEDVASWQLVYSRKLQ